MYIYLILQQIIASSSHIVAKDLTFELDPPLLLLLRAGFSALAYLLWLLFRKKFLNKFDRKDLPVLIILGILNIPVNQFLFLTSIELTTPPNVALAYALSPAFVLVIAIIFLKESSSLKKIIGVVIAVIGTVLVIFERGIELSSDHFLGNMLILVASLSWSLYTILGRDFSRKYGAIQSTAMTMITGYLLYIPIFIFIPVDSVVGDLSFVQWLEVAYLGLFTSVLGYALWYYALTKTEASKVAVFNNIQPVLTTILAVIFFGQQLSILFIIGGILIIIGVVLTQRG